MPGTSVSVRLSVDTSSSATQMTSSIRVGSRLTWPPFEAVRRSSADRYGRPMSALGRASPRRLKASPMFSATYLGQRARTAASLAMSTSRMGRSMKRFGAGVTRPSSFGGPRLPAISSLSSRALRSRTFSVRRLPVGIGSFVSTAERTLSFSLASGITACRGLRRSAVLCGGSRHPFGCRWDFSFPAGEQGRRVTLLSE